MWAEGPGVAVGSACRDAQAHEPLTAVLPCVCCLSFPSVKEGGQSVLGMRWHRARRSQRGVAQGPVSLRGVQEWRPARGAAASRCDYGPGVRTVRPCLDCTS